MIPVSTDISNRMPYSLYKKRRCGETAVFGSEKDFQRIVYHFGSENIPELKNEKDLTNKTTKEPLKACGTKPQIAFKGSFAQTVKTFFKGESKHSSELIKVIKKYINPNENAKVKSLLHNVDKHEICRPSENIDIKIYTVKPFLKNFKKVLFKQVMFLLDLFKKYSFKSKNREKFQKKETESKFRNELLGWWMNVTKLSEDVEKITKNKKLKKIFKDGYESKQEKIKISDIFEKHSLESLYSFKKGKAKGELSEGNRLEKFAEEVLGNNSKTAENSVTEELKKTYINREVIKKIREKEGSPSSKHNQNGVQFISRLISGFIPAWFIANDFYNLRMLNSDNEKLAEKERTSKLGQELFRIGLSAYQGLFTGTVFNRMVNRSLPFAVGLNSINSMTSNILSRVLTKRPVLPTDINTAVALNALKLKKGKNEKPESTIKIIEKPVNLFMEQRITEQRKDFDTYKTFKGNKKSVAFGVNGKDIKNMMKRLKKAFPAEMELKEFTKSYAQVKKLEAEDAKKMLEIAAENMGIANTVKTGKSLLEEITNLAIQNDNNVIIGTNNLYKKTATVLDFFVFPIKLSGKAGLLLINLGRRVCGLKPIKLKEKDPFDSVHWINNITGWAKKAHDNASGRNESEIKESAQILYGEKKPSFSPKIMHASTDKQSTYMKLTGFISVPFLAVDSYNVNLGETRDKKDSTEKMKHRALQDSTRQGISFWMVKSFNELMKGMSNSSLYGCAAATAIQTVCYETFTRYLVDQPITTVSHKKMKEIEKKRKNSNSDWIIQSLTGKITKGVKKPECEKLAKNNRKLPDNSKSLLRTNVFNFKDSNISELYKKFSENTLN